MERVADSPYDAGYRPYAVVSETARTPDKLLGDAMTGYVAEFAETREMLNGHCDDLKSGKLKPIEGEVFF
jgi:hypothetical protein